MDINYYDEHQEEFEAVKLALKGEMERIWGSMLKESGDSLDDEGPEPAAISTASRSKPGQAICRNG